MNDGMTIDMTKKRLKWVAGNSLTLAIPLEKQTVVDGHILSENYTPSVGADKRVSLIGSLHRYDFEDNDVSQGSGSKSHVLTVHDNGSILPDLYAIEVCIDDDGLKLRSMWKDALEMLVDNKGKLKEYNDFMGDGSVELEAFLFYNSEILPSASEVVSLLNTRTGYYVCESAGDAVGKEVAASSYLLFKGGCIKVLFYHHNTSNGAVSLDINGTGARPLYYNGKPVSMSNSWEDLETVEIYYDGSAYQAHNDLRNAMDTMGVSFVVPVDYIYAIADASGKLLAGIKTDGSVEWGKGVPQPVKTHVVDSLVTFKEALDEELEVVKSSFYYVSSPEWIIVILDGEGKVLAGIKPDGSVEWSKGVPTPVVEYITECLKTYGGYVSNDEWAYSITDGEGGVLAGLRKDGSAFVHKLDGVLNDWSNEKKLELPIPDEGAFVNLLVPRRYASSRLGLAHTKDLDWECELEYCDKKGNYFRKPILLDAQGDTSLSFEALNQAIDFTDDSKISFGGWVSQDSFHLKKYFQDVFRGQCVVSYWLMEEVMLSHGSAGCRPWPSAYGAGKMEDDFDSGALCHPDGFPVELFVNGKSRGVYVWSLKKSRDNYHMKKKTYGHIILDGILGSGFWTADGDLTKAGENGEPMLWNNFEIRNPRGRDGDGLYALRKGYFKYNGVPVSFSESNLTFRPDHVTVGVIAYVYGSYEAAPAYVRYVRSDGVEEYYEKALTERSGRYDGDNPGCLDDDSGDASTIYVKLSVERLSCALSAIDSCANVAAKRSKFQEYFLPSFFIDYVLVSQLLYHHDGFRKNWIWCTWDGEHWIPTLYDCDSVFGSYVLGTRLMYMSTTSILGADSSLPSKYFSRPVSGDANFGLYWDEVRERWRFLRWSGIFSVDNVMLLLTRWLERVGYERLKRDLELFPDTPSWRSPTELNSHWERYDRSGHNFDEWEASCSTYGYFPNGDLTLGVSAGYRSYVRYGGECYRALEVGGYIPVGVSPSDSSYWEVTSYKGQWEPGREYHAGDIVHLENIAVSYVSKDTNRGARPVKSLYKFFPVDGGFYNSVGRVREWLVERLTALDEYYGYVK